MKHLIVTLAAAFAVSAYAAGGDHKKATPPTAPAAGHHEATKPTATAPATTHGDDVCKGAKDHKKCMDEQKKKAM